MKDSSLSALFQVMLAKIVPALAGVIFVAIAVRSFAPAAYGQFSLVYAAANFVAIFSVAWVSQAVLRFAPGDITIHPFLWPITVFVLFFSAAIALIVSAIGDVFHWPLSAFGTGFQSLLFACLAAALALQVVVAAMASALQQFRAYRNTELVRAAALLGLTLLVAYVANGSLGLVGAFSLSVFLPSLGLAIYIKRLVAVDGISDLLFFKGLLLRFFKFGWPITIWAGIQATQSFMERNVAIHRMGAEEFGSFIAVVDLIARGVGVALMPVVTVLHPKIMKLVGGSNCIDRDGMRLLRQGSLLTFAFLIVIGSSVLLLQQPFATIFPAFSAVDTLTLGSLCGAAGMWVMCLLAHKPLEARNATGVMTIFLAISMCGQYFLLQFLFPLIHELAMPLSSLSSALSYMLLCVLFEYRKRKLINGVVN